MLISLDDLVAKYSIRFTGILHVGAHICEELIRYEKYLPRETILWVEAMPDKVIHCKNTYPGVLIEQAVVSDTTGEEVTFHVASNGESSSILEFGLHTYHHGHIHYVNEYRTKTTRLTDILIPYSIPFNFINLDIQGVELKALKGMESHLPMIDYIYTEVNADYVYKECTLITELDEYLQRFDFQRVETQWCSDYQWGDAFYIKKHLLLH